MKSDDNLQIDPSFLFLKYKGLMLPEEFEKKYEFYGYKCKKYASWSDVHVTKDSKKILSLVGDSLLDNKTFPFDHFSEISLVWEKIQRWKKDRDSFSIEPDLTDGFEKFQRFMNLGSSKPEVVDAFIIDNAFDCNEISLPQRWVLFCSICLRDFLQTDKRISKKITVEKNEDEDCDKFISNTSNYLKNIYDFLGKRLGKLSDNKIISNFILSLGISFDPEVVDRSSAIKALSSNIIVEFFDGPKTEFIKIQELQGNIIIKLNKLHRSNEKGNNFKDVFDNNDFWMAVGEALKSHMGSIDEINAFFDTLGKKIHLYKAR